MGTTIMCARGAYKVVNGSGNPAGTYTSVVDDGLFFRETEDEITNGSPPIQMAAGAETYNRVTLGPGTSGATTKGLQFGSGTAAMDTNLYRSAANRLKTDDTLIAFGVATFVQTGAVSDGDFPSTPPDGTIAIDRNELKIYVRIDGAWKKTAALT